MAAARHRSGEGQGRHLLVLITILVAAWIFTGEIRWSRDAIHELPKARAELAQLGGAPPENR